MPLFTETDYALLLPAAQLRQLTDGNPSVLAAAEAAAISEVTATLGVRYDVAVLSTDAWPALLRAAALDLVAARLALRSAQPAAPLLDRAQAQRAWLTRAAAGHYDLGLPVKAGLDPTTLLPTPLPLLGGSHPRSAQDRPE